MRNRKGMSVFFESSARALDLFIKKTQLILSTFQERPLYFNHAFTQNIFEFLFGNAKVWDSCNTAWKERIG